MRSEIVSVDLAVGGRTFAICRAANSSLRYPNHTRAFWSQVDKVLFDYQERKELLRVNGAYRGVAVALVRDDAAYDALRELAHWIRQ